jgi:hypothetical protein
MCGYQISIQDTKYSISSLGQWGNGFGRAVGRVQLYPLQNELVDVNKVIGIVVTHFSLKEYDKNMEASMFNNVLFNDIPCIFGGDFNTFGDDAAKQHRLIFSKENGNIDFCQEMVDHKGKKVIGPWLGWANDIPAPKNETNKLLDKLGGNHFVVQSGPTIADTRSYFSES